MVVGPTYGVLVKLMARKEQEAKLELCQLKVE
jgi:hypothetical protein